MTKFLLTSFAALLLKFLPKKFHEQRHHPSKISASGAIQKEGKNTDLCSSLFLLKNPEDQILRTAENYFTILQIMGIYLPE